MAVEFENCEFTMADPGTIPGNNTWGSEINEQIPDLISVESDINDKYNYENVTPSRPSVFLNHGIDGVTRTLIGGIAFNKPTYTQLYRLPKRVEKQLPPVEYWSFWSYLSTFWNMRTERLTEYFEGFWIGLSEIKHKLMLYATRFFNSQSPEHSETNVHDYMFSLELGPLHSTPIAADPLDAHSRDKRYTPISVIAQAPEFNEDAEETDFTHYILISESEYYSFFDFFEDLENKIYIVIHIKDENRKVYYPIERMVSYESGTSDLGQGTFAFEIKADLNYLVGKSFVYHLTTGRTYSIGENVKSVPFLRIIKPKVEEEAGVSLYSIGDDYKIRDTFLEFHRDVNFKGIVYCDYVEYIDEYLYESYGNLAGIRSHVPYNHDNFHGKTAINAAIKGEQDASAVENFNLAKNSMYGAVVSGNHGNVIGLFESYEYKVTSFEHIDGNEFQVSLDINGRLSAFFQKGAQIYCENTHGFYNVKSVEDYDNGLINIEIEDSSDVLEEGDIIFIRILNRFHVNKYVAETDEVPGYIIIESTEDLGAIKNLVNVINNLNDNKLYPEIILEHSSFNGVYHITDIGYCEEQGHLRIETHKQINDEHIGYNDRLIISKKNKTNAFAHIPWPTHKFIMIEHGDGKFEKYYIDSNMDTWLEQGDVVEKYQTLTRNLETMTNRMFPGWSSYEGFELFNRHDEKYGLLNMISENEGIEHGKYLPSGFKTIK